MFLCLGGRGEMMQKKRENFLIHCITQYGGPMLSHLHKETLMHIIACALFHTSNTLTMKHGRFLPVTALLFTIRLTVRAAEQKVDKIKIASLAQHQLFQALFLSSD